MKEYTCMRKIFTVLTAVMVLFTAVALADDLSVLTDEELLALHQDVLDEIERRRLPDVKETDSDLADIAERVISFFAAWNRNDPDEMLALCDSGWKATVKDPRKALLGILADMTPLDATIKSAYEIGGEGPDGLPYYLVKVNSHLDRNDGKYAEMYTIPFLVRKEEDGLWYINPTGLDSRETAEEESSAEAETENDTEAAAAEMVRSGFMSFRDAVDAAGEYASIGGDIDYLSVAASKDGCDYRTVTILYDHAKELYMAAMAAEDSDAAFEAFNAHAWSLPVCYTEKITMKPKEPAELEELAGKDGRRAPE